MPTMTTQILMHGAGGRMGQQILTLGNDDAEIEVAGGVDLKSGAL